ncbi:MAG: gamma-glutamyl-gamma-aminobutyrate hydrolase family protein [Lachnospiraceae bacterium]|nr:gamma-glutamyl-gamma-aminobutyrate hydrolase family protein [Lachnospiraceae bacterium]
MQKIRIAVISGKDSLHGNENYCHAVCACGAETVMLPLFDGLSRLREADGLLLPGGADADPALYGEEDHGSRGIDGRLDSFELAAIREAVTVGKPVLGICRGHQLINIFFGGSLWQDISEKKVHLWLPGDRDSTHPATAAPGSFLSEVYGKDTIAVNSSHHQAIRKTGEGLRAVSLSPDGVIEAVEHESLPVYGVQFHPERMCLKFQRDDTEDGLKLLQWFMRRVEECRRAD